MHNDRLPNSPALASARRSMTIIVVAAVVLMLGQVVLGGQQPAPKARPSASPAPPSSSARTAPGAAAAPQAPKVAAGETPEGASAEDADDDSYDFDFEPPEPPEAFDMEFGMPVIPEIPDMPEIPDVPEPGAMIAPMEVHVNAQAIKARVDAARMAMPSIRAHLAPFAVGVGPGFSWSDGTSWQTNQRFNDVAKETDPARRAYFEGRNFVADSEWDKAAAKFEEVVTKYHTSRVTDAALYWYAYSLKSESRWKDSYAACQRLLTEFPKSRWRDGTEKLLVQVAGPAGERVPSDIQIKQDEDIKIYALQGIIEGRPDQGVELARQYFKPGSTATPEFRAKVVILLSQVESPAATDLLVEIVRGEQDAKVRKQSLLMLGQRLDDKQRSEQVFGVLRDLAMSSDTELGKYAVLALGQDDGDRSAQLIAQLATSAQQREIRKQAIMMLAQRGGQSSCATLVRIFDNEKDAELQRLALVMLAQSDCPEAADKLMAVARSSTSVELRRYALINLAQKDPAKAVQTLVQVYDAETNETIKSGIVDGLGQVLEDTNDKNALHKLMQIAKNDASLDIRRRAIRYIGECKDPEATQFLVDLLK